jgi:hypothetical protein
MAARLHFHTTRSAHPRQRSLRLEPLEVRCLFAPLIGVDFGTGSVPTNWTQVTSVGPTTAPTTRTDLIDETGAATVVDLRITTSHMGGANSFSTGTMNSSTLPQHTQSLADVSNAVRISNSQGFQHFNASFGDLKPGTTYEVYVFAVRSLFSTYGDNQTVTISGADSPIVFRQNRVSNGNLWVNDQVGSSSQLLPSYAKLMTATVGGAIDVNVQMNSFSDGVVLAGLAIREYSYVVNNSGDVDDMDPNNGLTTLREAIRIANTTLGPEVITFDAGMSGQQIDLGGSEFEITEALIIDAAPLAHNVTINAREQSRIFNITATTGDFTLAGLTLTGGRTTGDDDAGLGQTSHRGGAIRSRTAGLLTLQETRVSGNSTTGSQAVGGGIYAAGAIALTQSTISGNSTTGAAAGGGGVFVSGLVRLTQSTISGNRIDGDESHGGGVFVNGPLTLMQSTIADNHATGSDSLGGGVFQTDSADDDPVSIRSSIIAGNTAAGGSPDLSGDAQSLVVANSFTYSLIGDTSGSGVAPATGVGNLLNVNPLLGPLADNGGPTATHALLPGSPAIDAGPPSPVTFYRFEETAGSVAADLIGVHPGTLKNFVASSQPGAPQVGGNAALFDGINDYVSVANPFSASQLNGASYSVELWFNPNFSDARMTLVALTTAAGHAVMLERIEGGYIRFVNRIPAGIGGSGNDLQSTATAIEGRWNHVAAVRDGASMRIYLNGAQVASLSNATGNLPADLRLTIGRLSDTQGMRYFAGKLDEVAIYNRALTPGEVALHASHGVVDQRGLFGLVDGDGNDGMQSDLGAYEAQVKPSADFDLNGVVDGADFLSWQRGLGAANATLNQGNSDGDTDIDHSDLAAWRVHVGSTAVGNNAALSHAANAGAAAAVRAPTTLVDAVYAAGDFTSLWNAPTASRPAAKWRFRRGS